MAIYRVDGTVHTQVYLYVEASSEEEASTKAESRPSRMWQENGESETEVVSAECYQED